ncbi:MAG: hypothetical protein WCS37_03900 [Chloroflexota bacterium]
MSLKYQLKCGFGAFGGILTMKNLEKARVLVDVGGTYVEVGFPIARTMGAIIVQVDRDLDPVLSQQTGLQPDQRFELPDDDYERVLRK